MDRQTVSQTLSTTTMNPSGVAGVSADTHPSQAKKTNAELAAQWAEARLAYPIYAALASQFKLIPAPYPGGEVPPARPTRSAFDRDLKWLDEIDASVLAYQLRQIPSEILNGSEPSLRAFIQRHVKKLDRTVVHRDKLDWLLAQYFALCAPEELYREEIGIDDVARVLQPVISSPAQTSECIGPLEKILADLEYCHCLRDVTETGIFEQSRLVKDSIGVAFYEPAALIAFSRFNFLLRRAFIRVLHNDLKAMGEAIDALEAKGKKTVDCRRAGLSAAETTSQLRYFCANWKQPFQKDYTEGSVTRSFEQLQALRTDLEDALHQAESQRTTQDVDQAAKDSPVALQNKRETPAPRFKWGRFWKGRGDQAGSEQAQNIDEAPASSNALGAEGCAKRITQQLTGVPSTGARAMATISLQDTKVLLSSWEVAAFTGDNGVKSEDIRRAVVARSLLAVAIDQRKRSGEQKALASSLSFARAEISYLQGRVENAKRMNNTESAINLGISAKRLVSSIEEAEKLQS
ncbi:MAG TPA: hypothetical protein VG322_16045 [Candidatus Acidoferrales bacterium]|nr:hypothetical protein [Candidatus Acidoferrales bacterium]